METKRSCGASSTPRHFLNSWPAKRCPPCRRPPAAISVVLFVKPTAGGEPRVISHVGCEADAARALARSGSQAEPPGGTLVLDGLGAEPDGRRVIVVVAPKPTGPLTERRLRMIVAVAGQGFELCAAQGASRCGWQNCRRAAPSNLCSRGSSAPARRCNAWSTRSPGCRETISPSSSPARAAPARNWWPARYTSARRGARRCSCRTTARPPRGSSPTASCSAIAAAASPARLPTSPASCVRQRQARSSWTKSAIFPSTCSRSCCGSSSRERSCRWARCVRSASMCA